MAKRQHQLVSRKGRAQRRRRGRCILRPRRECREALIAAIRQWKNRAVTEASRRRTAERRLQNARYRVSRLQQQCLQAATARSMSMEIDATILAAEAAVSGRITHQTAIASGAETLSAEDVCTSSANTSWCHARGVRSAVDEHIASSDLGASVAKH